MKKIISFIITVIGVGVMAIEPIVGIDQYKLGAMHTINGAKKNEDGTYTVTKHESDVSFFTLTLSSKGVVQRVGYIYHCKDYAKALELYNILDNALGDLFANPEEYPLRYESDGIKTRMITQPTRFISISVMQESNLVVVFAGYNKKSNKCSVQ